MMMFDRVDVFVVVCVLMYFCNRAQFFLGFSNEVVANFDGKDWLY